MRAPLRRLIRATKHRRFIVHTRFATPGRYHMDPAWLHTRVHIYMQYTLRSLQRQAFPHFDILLQCCEENRELMQPYASMLADAGVTVIHSVADGQCYLESLRRHYKELAWARIDSDDLYDRQAVAIMQDGLLRNDAVQCVRGFWWDVRRQQVRRWVKASPPFYAIRRPLSEMETLRDVYTRSLHLWRGHGGHARFRKVYKPRILPPGLFLVMRHGTNLCGGHGYGGPFYQPHSVLPRFGIRKAAWKARQLVVPDRELLDNNGTPLTTDNEEASE